MNTESKAITLDQADESAVQNLVNEFANTWNRHDMPAMHALNTDDAEWINVTGNHWRGNENVYRGHNNIHQTICANTTTVVDNTLIRAITPDVAIAVATMRFRPAMMPTGEVLDEAKTRGSFVIVRRDGAWKIAQFQNTIVDPLAEQSDPLFWDETGNPFDQSRK